jgi:hypothetical protein
MAYSLFCQIIIYIKVVIAAKKGEKKLKIYYI